MFYVLGGKQICVIHFSSAITILCLKEQIQNKHGKSLIFILMSCSAWSEEKLFEHSFFFCNFDSPSNPNPKHRKSIILKLFLHFSISLSYVYCHRAQKMITLYIHWHMNWMVSPWKKMKKLEQWICKINTLTLLKIPKQ